MHSLNSRFRNVVAAASFPLFVLLFDSTAAHAAVQCLQQRVTGSTPDYGVIPFTVRSAALNAAIQNWTANVPAHPEFKDWAKAKNKSTACNRVPNGIGGYNHTCVARATPCRNVAD